MKCDKLQQVENPLEWGLYYDKNEVDAAIAELKAEINRKEGVGKRWFEQCMEARAENVRLKRALWVSRAKAYRYIAELLTCFNPDYVRNRKIFTPNNLKQKQMNSLEWSRLFYKNYNRLISKAEEYK